MPKTTVRKTDKDYRLVNGIYSKKGWCKGHDGKWDSSTKEWVFPLTTAPEAAVLLELYHDAEYDSSSRAAYFKKRADTQKRLDNLRKERDAKLLQWQQELRPTLALCSHEQPTPGLGGGSQFIGYITGSSDLVQAKIKEIGYCRVFQTMEYPTGLVATYRGGYD